MVSVIHIRKTDIYEDWVQALRDETAKARITNRIRRLSAGNFGDAKALGGGIAELRIDYGPGYRVYFTRDGREVVLLLCGGDKSRQQADIANARRLMAEWKRQR